MQQITDIKPQIKDKKRCSIYLDGQFFCGLSVEAAIKNKLKCGDYISKEKLGEIQLESEKMTALDKALSYLSFCARTQLQMTNHLTKKGYTVPVIDYVLEKLKGYGYIDDLSYALSYAKDKSRTKGGRMIALELRQRGASDGDIEEAISAIGDQTMAAAEIAKKYLCGKEKSYENKAKAYRHLIGKGFDYDTAKEAVDLALKDEDS